MNGTRFCLPAPGEAMSYAARPTGAPGCWGTQYTDGDQECMQCSFKESCRPVAFQRFTAPPPPPPPALSLPVVSSSQIVPMPPRATYPAPPAPAVPYPYQAPPQPQPVLRPPYPVPQPQTVQQYQPQPQVVQYQPAPFSFPDPNNPSPAVPMTRPGAQGAPYYFCQYPGESVPRRLTKNMVLRGAEAMTGELAHFFRHWTWPPRS